jgi:hypothetical protein
MIGQVQVSKRRRASRPVGRVLSTIEPDEGLVEPPFCRRFHRPIPSNARFCGGI